MIDNNFTTEFNGFYVLSKGQTCEGGAERLATSSEGAVVRLASSRGGAVVCSVPSGTVKHGGDEAMPVKEKKRKQEHAA